MARKRPTIKGKGIDIFLGEEKKKEDQKKRRREPNIKATFYFSSSLLDSLDNIWIELHKSKRNLKKSTLVSTALEVALKEYKEEKEDSELYKALFT